MTSTTILWSVEEIEACEPLRAQRLLSAPSKERLVELITDAFDSALQKDAARLGVENGDSDSLGSRVVIQILIGEELSDWFFNGPTGYRAQFLAEWRQGLRYNALLVAQIRQAIRISRMDTYRARLLNAKFEDCGETQITREAILDSLEPDLSKLWFSGLLFEWSGAVKPLPAGLTGPKIIVGENQRWAAVSRCSEDSWIDLKGAFVGPNGKTQPKDPLARAKLLAQKGEA